MVIILRRQLFAHSHELRKAYSFNKGLANAIRLSEGIDSATLTCPTAEVWFTTVQFYLSNIS